MGDILIGVATIAAFVLVEKLLGTGTSLWVSLVVLAFCVGVFWEAGRAKRRAAPPLSPGAEKE